MRTAARLTAEPRKTGRRPPNRYDRYGPPPITTLSQVRGLAHQVFIT